MHLKKKPQFVFNKDGTIKSIASPMINPGDSPATPNSKTKALLATSPIGKFSTRSVFSMSALSGKETKIAWSELGYQIQPEDRGAVFMKMQGKPGVTIWNLVSIPLLLFCVLASNADVIQEVMPLLTDTNFFGFTLSKAAKLNTNAASIASFVAIPCLLLSGVVYDVLGRRKTIMALLLIGALSTYFFPLTPPNQPFFVTLRVLFQCSMVCLVGNTLINDYVIPENRGKATAVQNSGMTLGNIFSVSVMYSVTKNQQNLYIVFGLLGTLQVIWTIIMFFCVSEP
jgi:hypothetical protein